MAWPHLQLAQSLCDLALATHTVSGRDRFLAKGHSEWHRDPQGGSSKDADRQQPRVLGHEIRREGRSMGGVSVRALFRKLPQLPPGYALTRWARS